VVDEVLRVNSRRARHMYGISVEDWNKKIKA
jgi:hypothetical protein